MLSENLARKHGAKILETTFTIASKEDLATRFKRSLQDRTFLLPASNAVRSSLHSVKRIPTSAGHFRFDAARTDETGHADHFWAAALADRASSLPAIKLNYFACTTRKLSGLFAGRDQGQQRRKPGEGYGKQRAANNRWGGL